MKKPLKTEIIKDKIERIYKIFEEIEEIKELTKNELSDIDKALSNHYHNIEGVEIKDETDTHLMILKLKKILHYRRNSKINHALIEFFINSMTTPINKTKKRYLEILKKHEEVLSEIIVKGNLN